MDRMKLAAMLAGMAPAELLITNLKESIQVWELDPSDENWKKICATCVLIPMKEMTNASGGGLKGTMDLMDTIDKSGKMKDLSDRLEGKTQQ